ncbi:MAG: hypothetical protein ACRC67_27045 [Inquilinus sp.]|uniref:hypothetical protein n=1 Tax=Inquilinus sp. TaxID=1932117 RepID=UPI003F40D53D
MAERHREEVLNTILATCLGRRGVAADPETIQYKGRYRPDVIASFGGLRCAIEGKVSDTPQAEALVLSDARGRIEQGIAHIAIAVVYPVTLRTAKFDQMVEAMSSASLEFAVLTEAGDGSWHSGRLNDILAELRRAHDILVRDDVLQQAVDTLNIGLSEVAGALINNRSACDRLISVLGVGNKTNASDPI